jgi:hypothetical protein
MEEPKKVLRAQYLGSMQVSQATGMEVLNDAIDQIVGNTPINQWRNVNVAVAPSMISILTPSVIIISLVSQPRGWAVPRDSRFCLIVTGSATGLEEEEEYCRQSLFKLDLFVSFSVKLLAVVIPSRAYYRC